jgi:hypothetical protein
MLRMKLLARHVVGEDLQFLHFIQVIDREEIF